MQEGMSACMILSEFISSSLNLCNYMPSREENKPFSSILMMNLTIYSYVDFTSAGKTQISVFDGADLKAVQLNIVIWESKSIYSLWICYQDMVDDRPSQRANDLVDNTGHIKTWRDWVNGEQKCRIICQVPKWQHFFIFLSFTVNFDGAKIFPGRTIEHRKSKGKIGKKKTTHESGSYSLHFRFNIRVHGII